MTNLFAERIELLRNTLPEWQVDGLLVTNLINCTWLSGFFMGEFTVDRDSSFQNNRKKKSYNEYQ